jgi:signal transduction histidine kinase
MSIDRLFDTVYARVRRRYVELLVTISGLGIVFLAWPAQLATQLPLWGPGGAPGREVALAMLVGFVVTADACSSGLRAFRPIRLFLRGEPVDPQAVWEAAVRALPIVAMRNAAMFCLFGNIPVILLAGQLRGWDVLTHVGAWLASSAVTVTAAFFYILIWEVAYRPVLRDVDPLLPPDFAPNPHWLTLTRRSVIAITSVMLYTGIVAASITSGFESREARLWASVLATFGAAVTFGGAITALVSHSISSRVSDLKEALARIGEGDYGVRVPLRMGDELDAAGLALNTMALRLKQQYSELRDSRARLTSVENDERRRIERDLRVGVDLRLERLTRQLAVMHDSAPDLAYYCDEVRNSLDAARQEIRDLAHGIYPVLLESDGLEEALRDSIARADVSGTVEARGLGRLPREVEAAVYFCCLEALQNTVKHAGPGAHVTVHVVVRHRVLQFVVRDDGVGCTGEIAGHGLTNMRDRVRALGGDLEVTSMPGSGTTVTGWLTVSDPALAGVR